MNHFVAGHSDVDQVRDAVNLLQIIGEHVQLRPKGREHVGLCPFHPDRNPSMAVVTHKGNAFYKCHACGAGGDVFDFVMNYHKLDFPEALRYLANRAGITLRSSQRDEETATSSSAPQVKRADIRKANAFAAEFFRRVLRDQSSPAGEPARQVIAQRAIDPRMVETFMLGAAPDQWNALASVVQQRGLPVEAFTAAGLLRPARDGTGMIDAFRNRIIFPIYDELGNPVAFGARKINPDDEPKYLNSAESPVFHKSRTLYGLHLAKRAIIESRTAIITEGYTDVIACHHAGFTNVVGTLGTALTPDHAGLLQRLCDTVVLVFDGDDAGRRAADRALQVLFTIPIDVRICILPDAKDPDELLKLPGGRDRFATALTQTIDALEHRVNRLSAEVREVAGLAARHNRVKTFLVDLCDMGFHSLQGSRRTMVITRLADLLGVPPADVQRDLPAPPRAASRMTSPSAATPAAAEDDDSVLPRARRIAEFELLGLLLADPGAALEPLAVDSDVRTLLTERLDANHFDHVSARELAASILAFLRAGETFTVQRVLGSTTDPDARDLVTRLFFQGSRQIESHERTSSDNDPIPLVQAVRALESARRSDSFARLAFSAAPANDHSPHEPSDPLQTLVDRIHQRRQHGDRPAAIPRGVR